MDRCVWNKRTEQWMNLIKTFVTCVAKYKFQKTWHVIISSWHFFRSTGCNRYDFIRLICRNQMTHADFGGSYELSRERITIMQWRQRSLSACFIPTLYPQFSACKARIHTGRNTKLYFASIRNLTAARLLVFKYGLKKAHLQFRQ